MLAVGALMSPVTEVGKGRNRACAEAYPLPLRATRQYHTNQAVFTFPAFPVISVKEQPAKIINIAPKTGQIRTHLPLQPAPGPA